MNVLLIRRILNDFMTAFGGYPNAVNVLKDPASKKYISDIAGMDSGSQEAGFVKLAIQSGAFAHFNKTDDVDDIRQILDKYTGWKDDILDAIIFEFAGVMKINLTSLSLQETNISDMDFSLHSDNSITTFVKKSDIRNSTSAFYYKARQAYFENSVTEDDFKKAIELYFEAAKEMDADAFYDLLWLKRIEVIDISQVKFKEYKDNALSIYEGRVSGFNDTNAALKAGDMFVEYYDKPAQAFNLYHYAADHKNARAMYKIAQMYEKGYGTQENLPQAIFWYEKSADSGCHEAMQALARYYIQSSIYEKNLKNLAYLMLKSAKMGNLDSLFEIGKSTKNYIYCVKAAQLGNSDACVWCYKNYDRLKNSISGVHIYSYHDYIVKASYLGNPIGAFDFANLNKMVEGSEKTGKNAQILLNMERAGRLGSLGAMKYLGRIYNEGRVVTRNSSKSFEWYKMAAEHADVSSMNRISQMLFSGIGTQKNLQESQKWFELAEQTQLQEKNSDDVIYPDEVVELWKNNRIVFDF